MDKKFYLTTAIAYASSKPHIGNTYEFILGDAIVRYKKKDGYHTYFMTGTDEHGQKIERKAQSLGVTPQKHVDNISDIIKKTDEIMDVEYDHFVRTTDDYHMAEVQKVFKKLYDKGDIYKGEYSGLYCVECESYFTEKDLVDGCCPDCGRPVEQTKEEAYFLKLTPYQDRLIKHIKEHNEFIQPESRKNEMLNNFLKDPLPDLCVSRTSYKWGVPVSFDEKHVIYVWIDALLNYVTGIGFHLDKESGDLFKEFWPADCHLIGKDILRFHTIYWPIILMALDLPLPKQIFGHPWVLTNHNKMSKSKGNVVYADDLAAVFGSDAVRYYCLHEIPFAQDGNLTYELIAERSNSDLANTYGNLVSRTIAMALKYFPEGDVKESRKTEFDQDLLDTISNAYVNYKKHMDGFNVSLALEEVMVMLRASNKYIDLTQPWVLAKNEEAKETLRNVLYNLLEAIRISTIMLEIAIPKAAKKVYEALNVKDTTFENISFGNKKIYNVKKIDVLFQRIDVEALMKEIVKKEEEAKKKAEEAKQAEEKQNTEIGIEDFEKVNLVVGQILEAKKHPKADKLLIFKVDIGSEVRQIVSGIAKYYEPEALVGKKVIVVKNLKPIKLRGEDSCGMLLCAASADDKELELVTLNEASVGDIVR